RHKSMKVRGTMVQIIQVRAGNACRDRFNQHTGISSKHEMQIFQIVANRRSRTSRQSFIPARGNPLIDVAPEIFGMRTNQNPSHAFVREEVLYQCLESPFINVLTEKDPDVNLRW